MKVVPMVMNHAQFTEPTQTLPTYQRSYSVSDIKREHFDYRHHGYVTQAPPLDTAQVLSPELTPKYVSSQTTAFSNEPGFFNANHLL